MSRTQSRTDIAAAGGGPLPIQLGDSPTIDAFGRLRASEPQTLHDSKLIFDNAPLTWDEAEVSGGGTGTTYDQDRASVTMDVTLNTAGKRVRQTKRRWNYQPGKSQLVLATFVLGDSEAGVIKNVGYFDDDNGIFLSDNEGTIEITRRTSSSGSPADTPVAQAAWNVDPLDGTGPSGVTLDFTKSQILYIDMEWLGVGRVRVGFVVDGAFYLAHQFLNANNLAVVYMSTANLPVRYSIENDGTGAAAAIECICSSVISEGGTQLTGVIRSVNMGTTQCNAAAVGTVYACKGIRLKSTHLGATILLDDISMVATTATDTFLWSWILNPTVLAEPAWTNVTNSAVQENQGDTGQTVTGGTVLRSGYGYSRANLSIGTAGVLALGATIAGVADRLWLCVTPVVGTNQDIYASITYRELV